MRINVCGLSYTTRRRSLLAESSADGRLGRYGQPVVQRPESDYVDLALPSWLWGGDPQGFVDSMKFRGRRGNRNPGVWRICTEESYYRRVWPGLLKCIRLAGPGVDASRIEEVLAGPVKGSTIEPIPEAIEHVNQLGARLSDSSEIIDMFTHIRLSATVAPDNELAQVVQIGFDALREIPFKEEPHARPFGSAGIHLIERDPALLHRIKIPSVFLRFEYDQRIASGEIPEIGSDGNDPGFAAAFDLHSGMMMFDVYFGPLAGCLSPYVWCLIIPRSHGVLLISLGIVLPGTPRESSELLHTLPVYGSNSGSKRPGFEATSLNASIDWWAARLDVLFGVLTDPSVFADREGSYHSAAHLHALLTVEQLFRRVVSIQSAARDTHAARVLLFSVLDTLQRLTGRPLETHCSAEFASRTLDRLRSAIPEVVQGPLLWGPERAVSALIEMQDGFFLRHLSDDLVTIQTSRGQQKTLTLDTAVAQYLKVIRDATHGHGSNKDKARGKTNALLAQHNGQIPHEVSGLGFLYLLDVLSRPDVLRRILRDHAQKKD